jgi:hypothetical protein
MPKHLPCQSVYLILQLQDQLLTVDLEENDQRMDEVVIVANVEDQYDDLVVCVGLVVVLEY